MARHLRYWIFRICCTYLTLSSCFAHFKKSIHLAPHLKQKTALTSSFEIPVKTSDLANRIPTFLHQALDELHDKGRIRRDVGTGDSDLKPKSTLFPFNDSHVQMVVHWAGSDSNVVIALTRGLELINGIPSASKTSNVFVSRNYGESFISIMSKMKKYDNSPALISQFFNSPALNSHYMFVDDENKYIFRTQDYGTTVSGQQVPFRPSQIQFHQTDFRLALAMDTSQSTDGILYLTENFGDTWRQLQRGVRAFYWEDNRFGFNSSCIYVLRVTADDMGNVIRSCDFFSNDEIELLSFVHDFEIKDEYMFATRKRQLLGGTGISHQIWVSHYRRPFYNAQFPHALNHSDYYIADASEGQIFLCVSHDESTTHLYISDVNGTKFSQSLDDILYFHPNGSNGNTWLKYYMDEPFADLHKVQGMRGVYIATQLTNKTLSWDHQRTLISFDKGGEWQLVVAPERDVLNRPTNCTVKSNCSLHLTQTFDRLFAGSRSVPILSRDSAPGIVMAVGNTGQRIHVDNASGVYVSTDAGFTWHEVLQGIHFFTIADHGGILVAVKQYEPTNQIVYSTDEGETWHTYNFTTTPLQIHGFLTEPGEKTTVVFLFGSPTYQHSWIVTSIDLRSVFNYPCGDSDYKQWSLPDDTPFEGCLLGRKVMIERRVPHTNCYNGKDYVRETTVRNCSCTREDFECDFGYKPSESFYNPTCVEDKDMDVNIHEIPRPCPEGSFYSYTRGYVKIAGDTCEGGVEHRYAPLMYACRVQDMEEFLVYTSRDNINRRVLENSDQADVSRVEQRYLKNVQAVAYQLGQTGCLYWADNELHKIQRLCEDGNHTVEALHFLNIGQITSLAYDWQGLNIYWIDQQRRVIEVSKRDGTYRRELFNGTKLTRPYSLAIDPNHGWMYWTDSQKVQRTWMDGTTAKIETIVNDGSMPQDSAIAIDYMTERLYWVSGSSIKYVILEESNLQQIVAERLFYRISAIAIYKDQMYWASTDRSVLYSCDKTHCSYAQESVTSEPFTDLKVLDETSQRTTGNTACHQNGGCTQLCLLKPPSDNVNGKNRTCRCGENATLSVILPGSDEDEQCCPGGGLNSTGHCSAVLNSSCTEDQFACSNGNCISKLWTCDRDNDCGDRSDELNCPFVTCSEGHFTCDNGRCIPQNWKCDFDNDCGDESDEKNCVYATCGSDKFTCTDGRCINSNWRCDFDEDCADGSDEKNCSSNSTLCEEDEFVCATGSPHCLLKQYVCDGTNHCYDRSDETNCSRTSCPSWKRSCGDSQCVYASWWCDGDKDCASGADELNCTRTTVQMSTMKPTTDASCNPVGHFQCNNGMCISDYQFCDGIDDCGDNSDEINCGYNHTCSADEFRCANGRCIWMYMKCNSRNDCGDYSDERYCSWTTASPHCASSEFECYNSTPRSCIWMSFQCDGTKNCLNGEDELRCDGGTVCDTSRFFKCKHSQGCIAQKFVCDEIQHCVDGSDEAYCNTTTGLKASNITCRNNYFPCKYENRCIPYMFVCDGKQQCQHSSDENLLQCFDQPPEVNLVTAKMESTNATIKWATVSSPASYIVSYLSSQLGVYQNETNLTAANANGYPLKNLHPASQYFITVYANLGGKSVQKYMVITVSTLPDVPDPPVDVFAQVDESSVTLDVSWRDPIVFKGNITKYEVCIGKSADKITFCLPSREQSKKFDGLNDDEKFEAGKVYYIQVAAFTSAGEGAKSSPVNITFTDVLSCYVGDLNGVAVGNNSINVSWSAPQTYQDKIIGYRVEYFDQLSTRKTLTVDKSKTNVLVDELCSGTQYGFRVTPLTATAQGTSILMYKMTSGEQLLPQNVTVDLIGPTDVNISWTMPPGANKLENFTVYYSYKPDVMYSHKVVNEAKSVDTTTNQTVIRGLLACEVYFFKVHVSGSGICSLVPSQPIRTAADPKAQPEELQFTAISKTSGTLTWMASCIGLEPVGYIVSRTEEGTGLHPVMDQPYFSTNATYLNLTYQNLYPGATYTFTVVTTNPGARVSEPVTFTMDSYDAPFNLHEKGPVNARNGTLAWIAPDEKLPPGAFNGYQVLMCRQALTGSEKCDSDSAYKVYTVSKSTVANYSDLEGGYVYYFKVRLNKINGYYGKLSPLTEIIVTGADTGLGPKSPLVQLSQTNIIAIAVSVAVVILALVVIIGCFVVRHNRLQRSFRAYASSHYNSRSGTTTFTAADELGEDEDSPMIRGFSDDEPLVIA